MRNTLRRLAIGIAFAVTMPLAGAAFAQITSVPVHFAQGTSSTAISGTIKGDDIRDYVVRAQAGQEMQVTLSGSSIVYFNVLAPGSNDEAIFVGSTGGNSFSGTLGVSGDYKIRVYQMRATARRGETGNFKLAIGVTGSAGHDHASAGGLGGIAGMDSIAAIDAMTERGYANVDSFESGNTQYGIFYNREHRQCVQLTMADGKVVDARDIQTHEKCR